MKTHLFVLLILFSSQLCSQKMIKDPEAIKELKQRSLLVVLTEPDKKLIKTYYQKRIDRHQPEANRRVYIRELEEYKAKFEVFNSAIQNAIGRYWDFNKNVEYAYDSEVKEHLDKNNYAVLYYPLYTKSIKPHGGWGGAPVLSYLVLNREEKLKKKSDYEFNLPRTEQRKNPELVESDIVLSIRLMLEHLSFIENQKSDKIDFGYFCFEQYNKYCNELMNDTLYIGTDYLNERYYFKDLNECFGSKNIIPVEEEKIHSFIIQEDKKLIFSSFPIGCSVIYDPHKNRERTICTYRNLVIDVLSMKIISVANHESKRKNRCKGLDNLWKCE